MLPPGCQDDLRVAARHPQPGLADLIVAPPQLLAKAIVVEAQARVEVWNRDLDRIDLMQQCAPATGTVRSANVGVVVAVQLHDVGVVAAPWLCGVGVLAAVQLHDTEAAPGNQLAQVPDTEGAVPQARAGDPRRCWRSCRTRCRAWASRPAPALTRGLPPGKVALELLGFAPCGMTGHSIREETRSDGHDSFHAQHRRRSGVVKVMVMPSAVGPPV